MSDSSSANDVLGNLISYNRGNGVPIQSGGNGNTVGMRGESRDVFLANLGNVIIGNEGSGVLVHGGGT